MSEIPEVLFVCVHNAGRSQMAAALLAERGRGRARILSNVDGNHGRHSNLHPVRYGTIQ